MVVVDGSATSVANWCVHVLKIAHLKIVHFMYLKQSFDYREYNAKKKSCGHLTVINIGQLWHASGTLYAFLFVCLFVAALVLHCCCAGAFSSCREQGPLSSCDPQASHCSGFSRGAWALGHIGSVAAARAERWLSSCDEPARSSCGIWDPPRPGIEPMSRVLAGGFFSTESEGSPIYVFFNLNFSAALRSISINFWCRHWGSEC